MKNILFVVFVLSTISCSAQIKLSDASLKVDTVDLVSPCQCNDAVILNMEEDITILNEVKRVNKKSHNMDWLNEEYNKRLSKHWEFFTRCKSIYKKEGSGSNCDNYSKGEELNKKLSALQKELGMQ